MDQIKAGPTAPHFQAEFLPSASTHRQQAPPSRRRCILRALQFSQLVKEEKD